MANEKRLDLISRKDLIKAAEAKKYAISDNTHPYEALRIQGKYFREVVDSEPTVDAVEVDTVIEMFEYMLGDCPCNFSPVDEWLSERCELQNECPNPKDKRGCWKQFIKHFVAEMYGERKDNESDCNN